jgi:tRNA G18 (ribose-2'-O)-methylase SpoU
MSADFDIGRLASLRDRDLASEGLVVAEGRLLAERLLGACRHGGRAEGHGLFPKPRFAALGVFAVPSLAPEFEARAEGLCPVFVRPEAELAALAGYPFHRGVIAVGRRGGIPSLAEAAIGGAQRAGEGPSRLVILPATIDPENMGSIVRSAAALGYEALLVGPGSCDHLSRRALRVSMGAAFSLPALAVDGPEALGLLGSWGYAAFAAVLGAGASPLSGWAPPERLALLFGNEFEGLGPEWLPPEVGRLTIPMAPGSDSLNAAAAAAIFLHAASRGAG